MGLQGGGWMWILRSMKTLLETGEPMPQGTESERRYLMKCGPRLTCHVRRRSFE